MAARASVRPWPSLERRSACGRTPCSARCRPSFPSRNGNISYWCLGDFGGRAELSPPAYEKATSVDNATLCGSELRTGGCAAAGFGAMSRRGYPERPAWLPRGAPPDVRQDRIFPGLTPESEVALVRFRGAGNVEAVSDPPLVVIDRRQVGVGRFLVEEERQRFAAPPEAAVELGVGLDERVCLQVRAPEVVMADPCVQQNVCF